MRKVFTKYWSIVFPKGDGSEHTTKEMIGRIVVFGSLILLLVFLSIRAYKEVKRITDERKGLLFTFSKHEHCERS